MSHQCLRRRISTRFPHSWPVGFPSHTQIHLLHCLSTKTRSVEKFWSYQRIELPNSQNNGGSAASSARAFYAGYRPDMHDDSQWFFLNPADWVLNVLFELSLTAQ